jgi:biopolymer transport protein ExbD
MKRRTDENLGTPVASLIDVVFLLIIFFVVTATVEKDIIDETIRLAQAKYAQAAKEVNPQRVIINVNRDGDMNIAKMPITPGQLRQILRATRNDAGKNVPILIRCDGDARYEHVARVQEIIGDSGFYRVRLAAVVTE